MKLRRKKLPTDDRITDFCHRFNLEVLRWVRDYPRAVAAREAGVGVLTDDPSLTVDQVLSSARYMAGPMRSRNQVEGSIELQNLQSLARSMAQRGSSPLEVATLLETHQASLPESDSAFVSTWIEGLRSAEEWSQVPRFS